MNFKTTIIILFLTVGFNFGLVNSTFAQTSDCDATYQQCISMNPYNPATQPALHNAFNQGCETSFYICEATPCEEEEGGEGGGEGEN